MLRNVTKNISAHSYLVLKPSLALLSAMLKTNERILMKSLRAFLKAEIQWTLFSHGITFSPHCNFQTE